MASTVREEFPWDDLSLLVARLVEAKWAPLRAEVEALRAEVVEARGTPIASRPLLPWQADLLGRTFTIHAPDEVLAFVGRHDLTDLVVSAAKALRERFGDCGLVLHAFDEHLSIITVTDLEVDEAMSRLRALEAEWWIQARGERPYISLTLEFR